MDSSGHLAEQAGAVPEVRSTNSADDVELPYTAEQVVQQYLLLRNTVTALKKKHAAEIKPYDDAMALLEGYAATMMTKLKTTLSTEFGSAFWVRSWSYKCTDFDKFFPWVVKNKQSHMLTRHVSKEAIEEWIEVQKSLIPANQKIEGMNVALPPGLESDYRITVQFRKA